ncbi:MAG: RagB/SusD family nutrient uptake outer membrane protein [Ferruginibacter sp.]
MKKIYFIIIVSFIAFESCNKDLNQIPISTATTATFYQQPSDFLQGTNAIYNDLRGYPDRLMFLSEVRSDNIYPMNADGVARDHDPINNFQTNIPTNVYVEEAWRSDFKGIFDANTLLYQLDKNGNYAGSAALVSRLTAEAKFLRAFFYFDLVKYYGKLPIIDHPVSATEANAIGRSAVADVYTFIISDLQFAIANLPVNFTGPFPNYTSADVGRTTKYAAEAMLAKVYMTRSGPDYGIAGPGLGLSEWNLALPLLQDITNSGLFAFNTTPYTFPVPANGIFSYSNQNPAANKEAVFDIMFLTGQSPILGTDFPWLLSPQSYFNSFPTGNSASNGLIGNPNVSNDLLNDYDSADGRLAATIHTAPFSYNGTTDSHPFIRKYLDTTQIKPSRFDWGINFIAIRYTDILMMKAECILNGATGAQGDVDAIVNQVRERAGLPDLSNVTLPQLFDERRREFAGEGLRWFDLQRSGNLVTIMNAWINVEDAALKKINQVTPNDIIYPVPQTQLDAKPGLYDQNPGY